MSNLPRTLSHSHGELARFHLWLYSLAVLRPLRCISPAVIAAGAGRPPVGAANQATRRKTMNSVHLIGRLATDVEVKEVNGGSKVELHPGGGPQRRRGGLRNSTYQSLASAPDQG